MQDLTRRRFGTVAVLALASTALTSCAWLEKLGSTPITVSLANAQAEAPALLQALTAIADTMTQTTAVKDALTVAGAAEKTFVGLKTGESYAAAAEALVGALTLLLPLLPIPAATAAAITAGILLIEGLYNASVGNSVAAPASTSAAMGSVALRVIMAPIPIPVP